MTYEQIIKGWELIRKYKRIPTEFFLDETLDLINRQKAENERLKAELKEDYQTMKQALVLVDEIKKEIAVDIETAKAEAIKEFSEKLDKKLDKIPIYYFHLDRVKEAVKYVEDKMIGVKEEWEVIQTPDEMEGEG